ncbi:MAG: PTS sugar transporter subunit IIA [Pyrinomonadaceae bacterium]|nr:PTS sugar transporter subunit IIA [Pyrinomonadaceae bacterium]
MKTEVKSQMVGGVIVAHGQFAEGVLTAAEIVTGELPHLTAVSIGWHDEFELVKDEISRAVRRVSSGKGVLILTDMFGGTPTNLAAMFLGDSVEVITGVNLPMVLALASQEADDTLGDVAQKAVTQGRDGIYLASEVLSLPPRSKKDS